MDKTTKELEELVYILKEKHTNTTNKIIKLLDEIDMIELEYKKVDFELKKRNGKI